MIGTSPLYTFDAHLHEYRIDGVRVPGISELLDKGGLVNGQAYFTEESRRRGTIVHDLTKDFDLGVDLGDELKRSPYRGFCLGYMAAVAALQPEWEEIEVFDIHPVLRFGGRKDRFGSVFVKPTVAEIKSAAKARHHQIQTALQALLVAHRRQMKPTAVQRLCIYVKHSGKYSVEIHEDTRDFDVAMSLIKGFCTC